LAKSLRIPVLYYISPQIWAWRKGRVRQISRWVDHMAVIFPFEADFYERHGIKATFVGYPLLESVKAATDRATILSRMGLDPSKPAIALLPGSRRAEVSRHLPIMREAALQLAEQSGIQFFCVCASTIDAEQLAAAIAAPHLHMPVVKVNAMKQSMRRTSCGPPPARPLWRRPCSAGL